MVIIFKSDVFSLKVLCVLGQFVEETRNDSGLDQ